MRLIQDGGQGELRLVEYHEDEIPRYAILSHTWGADNEEITYTDFTEGANRRKAGWEKLDFCRNKAAFDKLQHFWIDTCCVDKRSSAELTEAINSMFCWYQHADKCYVYLSDVSTYEHTAKPYISTTTWEDALKESRWFRRGWTLQELIAPASVEFFSREGDRIGCKRSLEQQIYKITGIAIEALRGRSPTEFTVEERFNWVKSRETRRKEDKAYSMLGIFDVYMPLIYGEGMERAFRRLQEEIDKSSKRK